MAQGVTILCISERKFVATGQSEMTMQKEFKFTQFWKKNYNNVTINLYQRVVVGASWLSWLGIGLKIRTSWVRVPVLPRCCVLGKGISPTFSHSTQVLNEYLTGQCWHLVIDSVSLRFNSCHKVLEYSPGNGEKYQSETGPIVRGSYCEAPLALISVKVRYIKY